MKIYNRTTYILQSSQTCSDIFLKKCVEFTLIEILVTLVFPRNSLRSTRDFYFLEL
jgi:hypothetical protein